MLFDEVVEHMCQTQYMHNHQIKQLLPVELTLPHQIVVEIQADVLVSVHEMIFL
jgi:hypothetical protein